ncbi:MAG: PorV/PorQ family protein [candidate division KSB1 bacterium]|nr:PorV/PorQ family protein [candidate division KSB1 bacterium]
MFYNPAGLAGLESNFDIFLGQTRWIADINYSAGAAAMNLGNFGTVGISVISVDYGDIQGADLISLSDPKGYVETGNVDVGAFAFGLAYARQISEEFSMGGLVQYVGQQLGDTNVSNGTVTNAQQKLTLNFGIKYLSTFKKFRFAMALRNFSTQVKYEEMDTELPLIFMFGIGIDMLDVIKPGHGGDPLLVSAEFLHPNNYTERVNIGAEYSLMGLLTLRTGYEFNRDLGGLSAGIGIKQELAGKGLEINYSYSTFDMFNNVNRFSLNFNL